MRLALVLALVLVTGCAPKVYHHLQQEGSYKTLADCHVAHPESQNWCVERKPPSKSSMSWWSWDSFWEGVITETIRGAVSR